MNTLLRSALCIGATLAGLQVSQAQVLVFGNAPFSTDGSAFDGGTFEATSAGYGYTPGSTFTLDHIDLQLSTLSGSPTVTMQLYTGTGSPSGAAESVAFTINQAVGALDTYTFTPTSTVNLSAGTTYWIAISTTGGDVNWHTSDGVGGTAPSGDGTPAGGWVNYEGTVLTGGTGGEARTDNPNFAVYAAPVPEPHEYALIAGLGLCGFAVVRRRMGAARA